MDGQWNQLLKDSANYFLGLGVTALVGVWWARMTPNQSNFTLALGVVAIGLATWLKTTPQSVGVRLLWVSAVVGVAGLFANYQLWAPTTSDKPSPGLQRHKTSPLAIFFDEVHHVINRDGPKGGKDVFIRVLNQSGRTIHDVSTKIESIEPLQPERKYGPQQVLDGLIGVPLMVRGDPDVPPSRSKTLNDGESIEFDLIQVNRNPEANHVIPHAVWKTTPGTTIQPPIWIPQGGAIAGFASARYRIVFRVQGTDVASTFVTVETGEPGAAEARVTISQ